jgi:cytosine/adenosine deaminase-related metal-dependent hydrolase
MRMMLAFLIVSAGFTPLLAQPSPSLPSPPLAQPSPSLPSPPLVLRHATVIDVTDGLVRSEMTIVMTNGRITTVGQTDTVRLPSDAQVVDATSTFVIPGLWDMHVHWSLKEYLPLFIANGVTGVRVMWGVPMHHAWRQEIEQGTLLGPHLVIASRIVDGPHPIWRDSIAVGNAAEAREAVRQAKQEGADFIKIYDLLPRDAFFALVDESALQGLRFAGHVPHSVSVAEASDAGQHSIEHLTGLLMASSTHEDELRQAQEDVSAHLPEGERFPSRTRTRPLTRLMLETFSSEKASALFAHLTRNHTWQTPTLTVLRSNAWLDDPTFRHDPRLTYLPAEVTAQWDATTITRLKSLTPEDLALAKSVYQQHVALVGIMRRAGVAFLAGTDVLNPYCFPGFSLHDELGWLVEAGLTPLEAMQSATLNPARFLGKAQGLGTVEEGQRADLVLLDANPLEAISNTQRIHAVVVNGRLLDRAALDALLAQAKAAATQSYVPPIPQDVVVVAPAADVPQGVAAFSGRWAGTWENTLDHMLVVERIAGRNVTFIYSWGVAPARNITRPGFERVTGAVDEAGVLRATLHNGAEVSYRLSPDQQVLAGEYVQRGRTILGRFTRQ